MKKMILVFILFFSCTEDQDIIGDCFVSPDPERICLEIYEPVCVCNDLVYSNSCKAESAGNLKWKLTNKDVGENCEY